MDQYTFYKDGNPPSISVAVGITVGLLASTSYKDGNPPSISVAVGITVGLLASFVQSAGLTLQRKSHIQNETLPENERKAEHRRPLWLIGFAIFITSNILGSVFQIASLPVVILAPLGAVSLLWNAFFARLLLGDVFSQYMVIGTILIAGGAVLIAIFGIVPEPTHSLEDLLRLFHRQTFIVYFSLLGAFVLIALIVTHIVEARLPAELIYDSPPLNPAMDDIDLIETPPQRPSERTPLLMDNKSTASLQRGKHLANTKMWLAISYASASGILSGMCLIFAKSGVELLILTITGQNQFWRWESWALVGGLVIFALLQLWYLHKSLILADPTLVCPLAFCFYNLSSIFNGLVYYDQFSALSTLHLLLVLLGIAILLAGVWAVSIQAGGTGRVEVGTWQEGDEVLTAEVIGTESAIHAPTILTEGPTRSNTLGSTARRRLGISTDEPVSSWPLEAEEDISPLPRDIMGSPLDGVTPFPSSRSPPSPQASTNPLHARSPTSGRQGRNRHSGISHGDPHRKFSAFFDPNAGTTTGLSIGLGATSPGFALVPRRRVSSATYSGESFGRGRRTLSEGDINILIAANDGHSQSQSQSQAQQPQQQQQESSSESNIKKSWKWLRNVFKL